MTLEIYVTPAGQFTFLLGLVLALPAIDGAAQSTSTPPGSDTAFALEQQGRFSEAETAWRSIVKAHPSNAEAYAHLGFLEARQEHYKEAIPLYRKALALNPAMPGLRLNLGLALFKAGQLKEAIGIFTPLLKSLPASSPEALRVTALLGIAHYGLGEYRCRRALSESRRGPRLAESAVSPVAGA